MEFQAIILCGPGRGLEPLVSPLPKALLPIANKPMLYYPLEWCQRGGISSAIVVAHPSAEQAVSQYIKLAYNSTQKSPMRVEVVAMEGETGFIVRSLKDKIKHDLIVVPCDFITDVPPQTVIDIHRNQPVNTIGTAVFYKNTIDAIDNKSFKPNLTLHSPLSRPHPELLDTFSRPKENDELRIRMTLLWEHPQTIITTTFLESFIYLFSRRVLELDLTLEGSSISSSSSGTDSAVADSLTQSSYDLSVWKKPWGTVVRDIARQSWKHGSSRDQNAVGFYPVPKEHLFIRCDSLTAYFEANRIMLKQAPYTVPPASATSRGAGIGRDSLVGIGTEMDEKTNVKRSIIGSDCKFGRECRISGCVIMDGVVLGNNVILDNCVIANGVMIEDRARLTGCTVEGRYIVAKGTQSKNEILRGYSEDNLFDSDEDEFEDGVSDDDDSDDDDFDAEVNESDLEASDGEGIDDDDDDLFDRS
ncbi:nucleotide-diphospho-sugar transferase [Lipomyces oligophaga]|uniref:nucleotide-diphospho-sugar transferase n=1 Tax=Lipomyces oligophaga TaxID=45792 RepID=UPI0034CD65B7